MIANGEADLRAPTKRQLVMAVGERVAHPAASIGNQDGCVRAVRTGQRDLREPRATVVPRRRLQQELQPSRACHTATVARPRT